MDIFEVVKNRRSIRKYTDKPIEEEKLLKILEAARLSPSAANQQPWNFIVIKDKIIKEQISKAYTATWFANAPIVIVACANPESAWRRKDGQEFWKVDIAIAMQSLILTAYELGLGTCWICAFDEKILKAILGIPEKIHAVAMTTVGYPAEQKGPVTDRKSLTEIIHHNCW